LTIFFCLLVPFIFCDVWLKFDVDQNNCPSRSSLACLLLSFRSFLGSGPHWRSLPVLLKSYQTAFPPNPNHGVLQHWRRCARWTQWRRWSSSSCTARRLGSRGGTGQSARGAPAHEPRWQHARHALAASAGVSASGASERGSSCASACSSAGWRRRNALLDGTSARHIKCLAD